MIYFHLAQQFKKIDAYIYDTLIFNNQSINSAEKELSSQQILLE
jgi:hypothetical protein